jgi:small subunit ribosomal protein S4
LPTAQKTKGVTQVRTPQASPYKQEELMARYKDAVCKLCRREGEKLFLKGERCLSPKCAIERRNYPPGEHGRQAQYQRKVSDYGLQLRAKQKARRVYGVLERQFRRNFREAERRRGLTGTNLLILLESRLDNVVYRLGFAASRAQARQWVRHGHIEVNGRKVNIPSYLVEPGDVVAVRPKSRQSALMTARVLALPDRKDLDVTLDEQLIVEYYSR